MTENNIPKLLIQLRKERGYTQSDLADRLDVTFQAVSKWERGENLPDAYMLIELAKIYGITVDEILNGKLIKRDLDDNSSKKQNILIIIGVLILMLAPISIFLIGPTNYTMYVPIILVAAAISVGLFIYASIGKGSKHYQTTKSKAQRRREEIVYTIAAGIFLVLGLVFDLFHIAWIIFIFAYALTVILDKE